MEIGGVSIGIWGLLGGAVLVFGLVLSLIKNMIDIWRFTRPTPPNDERYVLKPIYDIDRAQSEKRMDHFEHGLSGLLEAIDKERAQQSVSRRTIHRRVNKILTGLARVQGAMGIHPGDLNDEDDN